MVETYEKQIRASVKGEIRFPAYERPVKEPKIVLGLMLALVSLQMILFLWTMKLASEIHTGVQQTKAEAASPQENGENETKIKPFEASKSFAFNFDLTEKQPVLGKDILLITNNPDNAEEKVSVRFEEKARLGSSGRGMRIDYQLAGTQENAGWVSLDFTTRGVNSAENPKLVFWLKGDAQIGFHSTLELVLSDEAESVHLPVSSISSFWKRYEFDLSRIREKIDLKNLRHVIFVIGKGGEKIRQGTYSLDQLEIA